jgi:hypothetical protein
VLDNPQTSTVPKVVPTINPGGSRTERIRHQKKANHKAGRDSFQEVISTAKDDKNKLVMQGLVNKHIPTFPPERVSHVLDAHEIQNDTNLNELQHNAAYHNECLIRNLFAHYLKSWDVNVLCEVITTLVDANGFRDLYKNRSMVSPYKKVEGGKIVCVLGTHHNPEVHNLERLITQDGLDCIIYRVFRAVQDCLRPDNVPNK